MQGLLELAGQIGARLKSRGQTVAVAEYSAGGLIAASLLAQAGASAFFVSGAVVYTRQAREGLMGISLAEMEGIRSASEPYALLLARRLRERFGATWGLAETGASGPSGNSYGDAPGHSCLAISGPVELVRTIETGSSDRIANMRVFAASALGLLHDNL